MADFRCFDVSFVSDQTAVSRSGQSVASDSPSSAQASGQTAVSRSGQSVASDSASSAQASGSMSGAACVSEHLAGYHPLPVCR